MPAASWLMTATAVAALMLAGMHVATAAEGDRCGDRPSFAAGCGLGLWCEPQPGRCAKRDGTGTCVRVPRICPMIYQPVCGCDGKTYGNDCERRGRRVRKAHDGAC